MGIVLPVAMQSLLSALVSASDALMLGLVDQNSLSAVSLAGQVQFVLTLFQYAFYTGAAVFAAQYWGIRDKDTIERILGITLRISVPVSGAFSIAAIGFPGLLMHFFTNEEELVRLAIPYLRVVGISYLLTGFSQVYLTIMKNSGRVIRSTVYSSVSLLTNIVLNLMLIFGLFFFPELGILGAALATVIARVLEISFCFMENRRQDVVKVRMKYLLRTDPVLKKRYYHMMAPVLANEVTWGVGFTMFTVIMGHLGSDAVAANAIANIVKNILLCFCMGVSTGSAIIMGNLLGAGQIKKARACGIRLIQASLFFGAAAGISEIGLSPLILQYAHTLTVQAMYYLSGMIWITACNVVAKSFNMTVIGGIFSAGGDTKFGFYCDLVNMWGIILPIGSLAAFYFHLPVLAVFLLLNLDEIIKIPVEAVHYRKYKWLKNLTAAGEAAA